MESRTSSEMTRKIHGQSADEAAIRETIERWTKAVNEKDADAAMHRYAEDFRVFGIAPPLEMRGTDAWRSALEAWLVRWKGPVTIEMTELEIEVDRSLAYSTSINHITGTRTDGDKADTWVRATLGWRKMKGEWLVTHEHVSVPFYMDGSLRAAVDLRP